MSSSYALRLAILSAAVLFLAHLFFGLAVAIGAPAVVRRAERWRAATAARVLFALRMLPAAGALFVVCAICVPSYLRLEPDAIQEDIGAICLAAAALGIAVWALAMTRAARALAGSMRHVRAWRRRANVASVADARVWIIDGRGPTLALAGIFRPMLIVSRDIVEALPPDQLAAALRHELAHASAWDNFKRLLILLTPSLALPGQVERAWARFTEWSADDRAASGDPDRAVSLAAALVSVARMGSPAVPPLATALMANAADLQVRVDRLLRARAEVQPVSAALIGGSLVSGAALMLLALHPATLAVAYEMLERLVD